MKAAASRVVPEDLEAMVRETVRATPGLKGSEFKKSLPASHRAFGKEASALAMQLAERGELFSVGKASAARFFGHDPIAHLDATVPKTLGPSPVDKDALKELVSNAAPRHVVVLDAWLKSAVARGVLHRHAPAPPAKKLRFGSRPDWDAALSPVYKALQKALLKPPLLGISKETLARLLVAHLGASPPATESPATPGHGPGLEQFLAALRALARENPREPVFPVRALRARTTLDKTRFDQLALELARERTVTLHQHDHAAVLPELERAELVQDASGNDYVGIALKRDHD